MTRHAILFLTLIVLTAALSDSAIAQGTGGTNQSAAPSMVFPIRPRVGPAPTRPVPNVSHAYPQREIRLRRAWHPYSVHRRWR